VNKAVVEMDKVTQQNAASAEESSSAASELSSQAEELAAMVASFQLEGGGRGGASRRPAALQAPKAPADRRANGARSLPARAAAEKFFPTEDEAVREF
jgi:methyl-accepting chemotaxis protein